LIVELLGCLRETISAAMEVADSHVNNRG
jgi:hypothetical protein